MTMMHSKIQMSIEKEIKRSKKFNYSVYRDSAKFESCLRIIGSKTSKITGGNNRYCNETETMHWKWLTFPSGNNAINTYQEEEMKIQPFGEKSFQPFKYRQNMNEYIWEETEKHCYCSAGSKNSHRKNYTTSNIVIIMYQHGGGTGRWRYASLGRKSESVSKWKQESI